MRKRTLFMLTAMSVLVFSAHTFMADIFTDFDLSSIFDEMTTERDFSEEETEEITTFAEVNADLIWGEWYGAGSIGDSNYSLHGDALVLPDGMLSDGTNLLPYEKTDDTHFTVNGMEGLTITGEYGFLTQEEIDDYNIGSYSMFYREVGSPRIIVTIALPDPNNPLATYEVSTSSIFLKQTSQNEFLKQVMQGKTWKIGDNMLKINDGKIDLNDGSATGTAFWFTKEGEMKVSFSWDGSSEITYVVTELTDSSITLCNTDNEADIITLELSDVTEVAEAAEEEQVTE